MARATYNPYENEPAREGVVTVNIGVEDEGLREQVRSYMQRLAAFRSLPVSRTPASATCCLR